MFAASAALAASPVFASPPALGFIDSIGGMELMLVAFVGLLLFGGKGLPEMARTFGKALREFKKATANVENEVKRVMNEEPEPRPRPRPRPAAPRPLSAPKTEPAAPADTPPASAPASPTGDDPAPAPADPLAARRQAPPSADV